MLSIRNQVFYKYHVNNILVAASAVSIAILLTQPTLVQICLRPRSGWLASVLPSHDYLLTVS